jgi:hypothetical protein
MRHEEDLKMFMSLKRKETIAKEYRKYLGNGRKL